MIHRPNDSTRLESGIFCSQRRGFLKQAAGLSLLLFGAKTEAGQAGLCKPAARTIALDQIHTGDKLKLTYFLQGSYVEAALQEIRHLMRDYHTGETHPIDPYLLDQLYTLQLKLGIDKPFQVFSGYRSPRTNAALRRRMRGVGKNSFHMHGRAIDIHVEGLDMRKVRDAALGLRLGGVGYYRRAGFVHLDTGHFRYWH